MTLEGKVALVTGSSRGIGRAIARALGEAGATVYVTGRTAAGEADPAPGTIERTAREVTSAGGRGIPVRCDHGVDADVATLFGRIEAESGRLDVLVNNAHSGVADIAESVDRRFWEIDPGAWDRMNHVGLRGHYVASFHAARIMVRQRSGLIVNVSSFGAIAYLFTAAYGVGKAALDRLTRDLAFELRSEGVAVVSLWPGLVRTELTSALVEDATPGYRRIYDAFVEDPIVSGRAVAALASGPDTMRRSGTVVIAAEIARRRGLLDGRGRRPESPRSLKRFFEAMLPGRWRVLAAIVPRVRVPMWLARRVLSTVSERLKQDGGYRASRRE